MAEFQSISTSTAHLACLCGAVDEPGTLLSASPGRDSSFPVSSRMCHCDACRYTTGNLLLSSPALNKAPSATSLSRCTGYASSATVTRYFCAACGCHCFIRKTSAAEPGAGDEWLANAGIIERDPLQVRAGEVWARDLVVTERHHHIADTGDGGLAPRLARLGEDDRAVPLHMGAWTERPPVSLDDVLALRKQSLGKTRANPGEERALKAACHCGAIAFSIRRPDYAVDTQGVPARHIGTDKTKYPALFCACRWDRLGSGAWFVQPWTYIPPANITFDGDDNDSSVVTAADVLQGSTTPAPAMVETISGRITHYRSSSDSVRSFCRSCGAVLFYTNDDRPALANVAVGILRADNGALASRWLEWKWGRVVFFEHATEATLLRAIRRQHVEEIGEDG